MDEDGSASTEWVVAVAVVIMMAVPVMALIGDGSEKSSEDVVVSIQDADSFGGDGFHGNDGNELAGDPDGDGEGLFQPGANLGVGFSTTDAEQELGTGGVGGGGVDRPRFYSNSNGGVRRDKPTVFSARRTQRGDPSVQGSNAGAPDIRLPTAGNRQAVLGAHDCFVPGSPEAQQAAANPSQLQDVVASGR